MTRARTPAQRQRDNDNALRLSLPDFHRLRIARDTLRMSPQMVALMGGPTKAEATETIYELTRSQRND